MNVQNIDVTAGESPTITLAARDVNNAVQNLTGFKIAWYVGRGPFDPDNNVSIFTKTGTVVSAALGTFTVPVLSADTVNLQGTYRHQAWTTDVSGNTALVVDGQFRVRPGIVSS